MDTTPLPPRRVPAVTLTHCALVALAAWAGGLPAGCLVAATAVAAHVVYWRGYSDGRKTVTSAGPVLTVGQVDEIRSDR